MLDPEQIFPIGIGTWGIGGLAKRDSTVDEQRQIDAIAYMIDHGMNFVEANMWYSQGYSVELLAQAIEKSTKQRTDLFICAAIYLKDGKTVTDAKREVDTLLELLQTNYLDTLQFIMPNYGTDEYAAVTDMLDTLLSTNTIRYTSITNEDLPTLKKFHEKYQNKLFSHEVAFNLEIRANQESGAITYAQENGIKTVVFQSLRRNRTALHNWPLVVELASKYRKTQNQILMNWVTSKGYLPLTKSETVSHINEHIAALDFEMGPDDHAALDAFIPPNYSPPKIDWDRSGNGATVDQLSNVFDDRYKAQNPS